MLAHFRAAKAPVVHVMQEDLPHVSCFAFKQFKRKLTDESLTGTQYLFRLGCYQSSQIYSIDFTQLSPWMPWWDQLHPESQSEPSLGVP